jgi:XRE family transcriptional regulator of biofilm formation
MTIGARVRRERQKRGWTVRELARRAAVSPGAVSKLEGGTRLSPSLELGKRLAKALGVTLDYLAGMYDEEATDAAGGHDRAGAGAEAARQGGPVKL